MEFFVLQAEIAQIRKLAIFEKSSKFGIGCLRTFRGQDTENHESEVPDEEKGAFRVFAGSTGIVEPAFRASFTVPVNVLGTGLHHSPPKHGSRHEASNTWHAGSIRAFDRAPHQIRKTGIRQVVRCP